MSPHGPGETATAYAAAADLFAQRMIWLGHLFTANPHLRAAEAIIKPHSIDVIAHGFNGILRDWDRALPPIVLRETGFFPLQSGLGVEDVLRTGVCSVHVHRLDGAGGL
jgi:hypothetical protein